MLKCPRSEFSLGIRDFVKLESVALTDFRSVQVLTKIQPDEVYNLAGAKFSKSVF